jgi:competence ComEA-like helix-hairpin-helix protein
VERRYFARTFRGVAQGVLLTALVLPGSQEKTAQPLEERAKASVQKVCVSCHEMDIVTATRRTRIGWERNVEDMVSRGAEGSDQEMAEVVAYLTKYFGKLNVNTATAQQLREFLGLSEKEAQAIAAYRDRNGTFKDFEQLKAVPDVSAGKLQEKRSLIAFSL